MIVSPRAWQLAARLDDNPTVTADNPITPDSERLMLFIEHPIVMSVVMLLILAVVFVVSSVVELRWPK